MGILNSIKSNETIGKIISNLVPSLDEINGNVMAMHKKNIKNHSIKAKNMESMKNNGLDFDKKEYDRIMNSMNMSEAILGGGAVTKDALKQAGISKGKYYSANMKAIRGSNNENMGVGISDRIGMRKDRLKNYYFGEGVSSEARYARFGVTGAGIIGASIGSRYATGGGLTRNSKGERDIIGVPFL